MLFKERTFAFTHDGLNEVLSYKGEFGYRINKVKSFIKRHEAGYQRALFVAILLLIVTFSILTTNFAYTVSNPLAPVIDSWEGFKIMFEPLIGI